VLSCFEKKKAEGEHKELHSSMFLAPTQVDNRAESEWNKKMDELLTECVESDWAERYSSIERLMCVREQNKAHRAHRENHPDNAPVGIISPPEDSTDG